MRIKNIIQSKRRYKIILNEGQVRRLSNKLITDSQTKVKSR
jgi:hypothetical protein